MAKEISTYHRYNYQIRNSDPRVFHKKSDYENSHVDKRGKIVKINTNDDLIDFKSNFYDDDNEDIERSDTPHSHADTYIPHFSSKIMNTLNTMK